MTFFSFCWCMATAVGLGADKGTSVGVALQTEKSAEHHAALVKRIDSAPAAVMKNHGLAAALGGAKVSVTSSRPQEILIPIPQMVNGQIPVSYFVTTTPSDAVTGYRLWDRGDGNVFLRVRLVGKSQEVSLNWSSVVLIVPAREKSKPDPPDPYRAATGCAQSKAAEIEKLASELWPQSGKANEFAAAIQRHIREMKRVSLPRSLDAVGILKSGMNGICTANANLACALMRSKGIACRSLAVIPPNGMKLEMHRIVEYFDEGRWIPFDPSMLSADIPAKPWQNIVMAKTSIKDEEAAMKPRMGVMVGCPYGQELELLTHGVNLFGQDFFWTTAKPLAEFEPTEEATRVAKEMWTAFLKSGKQTQWQIGAGSAKNAEEMMETLKCP
jgi:hypothetical protein